MPEPRVVPPEEARKWLLFVQGNAIPGGFPDGVPQSADLAHTAVVLGEQREAVLKLHVRIPTAPAYAGPDWCGACPDPWPCSTARALGVE